MLTSTDEYKEVRGILRDCYNREGLPSLQGCGDQAADEVSKQLLVAGKVHSTVMCGECHKPRCVYMQQGNFQL